MTGGPSDLSTDPGRPAATRHAVPAPRRSLDRAPALVGTPEPGPRTAAGGPARRAPVGRLLVLGDLFAGSAALVATPAHPWVLIPVVLLTVVALADSGLYARRLQLSMLNDAPQLWLRGLVPGTAIGGLLLLFGGAAQGAAVISAGFEFVLLAGLTRALTYSVVTRQRASGARRERGLLLGAGPTGLQLVEALRASPTHGVEPVAFADVVSPLSDVDLPVLNLDTQDPSSSLVDAVRRSGADVLFVTPSAIPDQTLVEALHACDRLECDVFVVPHLHELQTWSCHSEELGGLPLLRLRRAAHRSLSWRVKRAVDVVVAASALVLGLPVLLACAVLVRCDGGPGVLFRQARVGLDGKAFTIVKFRSLRPLDEAESATNWNISDDDRLSTVGRLLRKSSLDELPQLWNVLRGDMSLVGPRPERPHFVEVFQAELPHYGARSRVPVGVTGWAQVNGLRGDTSISDRARYDNQYIENWSLWLDMKILLLTVAHVLRAQGG